jgi:membrane-associated protease RseP (regulator of RpoE activity)
LLVLFVAVRAAHVNISGGTIHLQFCFSKLLPKSAETFGAQFTVRSLINIPCYLATDMHPLGKFPNLDFSISKLVKLLVNITAASHFNSSFFYLALIYWIQFVL